MTTLGASLGARFAVSSAERSSSRKKVSPKSKTMTCATDAHVHDALNRLSIKLGVTRSRAIEMAVEELCAKHGIEIERPE